MLYDLCIFGHWNFTAESYVEHWIFIASLKQTHTVSQIIHAFVFQTAFTIPMRYERPTCIRIETNARLLFGCRQWSSDSRRFSNSFADIYSLRAALPLLFGYFGLICNTRDLRVK